MVTGRERCGDVRLCWTLRSASDVVVVATGARLVAADIRRAAVSASCGVGAAAELNRHTHGRNAMRCATVQSLLV